MANQLTAKNTLLISTSGTPDADDVITTNGIVFVNPKAKSIQYKDIGNGALGNEKSIINNDYVTAEFTADVNARASGDAGKAPKYGELFKICGLEATVDDDDEDDNDNVTYTPASSFVQGTAISYMDGTKREVTGIAGTFTFGGAIGEIAKFSFSLKGFTTLAETAEENPTVALDTNPNLVIKSITAITIGGSEIDLLDFSFDMGVDIQELYALNRKEFYINDYKPTIKVSAVKTKGNATHWTELNNNAHKEVKIILGDTEGNIIEFKAPYCAPTDVSESDDNGKVKFERTWSCENNVGNDNFSIVYR